MDVEITVAQLKDIHKKLKPYAGYMDEMVKLMNEAKARGEVRYANDFNKQSIYNVFNGVTKNAFLKIKVYTTAMTLYDGYNENAKKSLIQIYSTGTTNATK